MASFFDLVEELQSSIDALNSLLSGGDTETVQVSGVAKPTISKSVKDNFTALQTMVNGRLNYQTLVALNSAGAPPGGELAEVWGDSTSDNNGIYGWNGSAWVKSQYDYTELISQLGLNLASHHIAFYDSIINVNTTPNYERGDFTTTSGTLVNSIRGWMSPFKHNGSVFNVIQLTLRADAVDTVNVSLIRASDSSVIASGEIRVDTTEKTYTVALDKMVDSLGVDEIAYIAYRSKEASVGISYPSGGAYDAGDADTGTYPEKYLDDGGVWRVASSPGNYKTHFRLINANDLSGSADLAHEISAVQSMFIDTDAPDRKVNTLTIYHGAVSGLTGWRAPVKYDGTEFDVIGVAIGAPASSTAITAEILDSDRNPIATGSQTASGSGMVYFFLDRKITSQLVSVDDPFYVSYHSTDEVTALGRGVVTYDAGEPDPNTYREYYKNEGVGGSWAPAAPIGNYGIHVTFFDSSQSIKQPGTVTALRKAVLGENPLILPPVLYACDGVEANIYFDNIVKSEAEEFYFKAASGVGVQQEERFTVDSISSNDSVTITCYDKKSLSELGVSTLTIRHALSTSGTGDNPKCLFIGDSTTEAGVYTGELLTLASTDAMDITLYGSQNSGLNNNHEGYGGKTFNWHYSDAASPFVFGGSFDFAQYATGQGITELDHCFFHLGINDVANLQSDDAVKALAVTMISNLESMITNIKAWNANVKFGVMVTIPPSKSQDAFGNNHGASNTHNKYFYKRKVMIWCEALIEAMKDREGENIYLVPVNLNLDTVNNMHVSGATKVNARSDIMVARQSNAVHPADEGYYQMADAIWSYLKWSES